MKSKHNRHHWHHALNHAWSKAGHVLTAGHPLCTPSASLGVCMRMCVCVWVRVCACVRVAPAPVPVPISVSVQRTAS